MPHSLPRTVTESVDFFQKAKKLHGVLGKEFCELYLAIKQSELSEYLQVISPWERRHLMLNV